MNIKLSADKKYLSIGRHSSTADDPRDTWFEIIRIDAIKYIGDNRISYQKSPGGYHYNYRKGYRIYLDGDTNIKYYENGIWIADDEYEYISNLLGFGKIDNGDCPVSGK